MTIRFVLVLSMMSACLVCPAWSATDPTLQQTREWTEAQALIDGTDAPELFENQSTGGLMRVRHKASGLICDFVPGARNNTLMLFPSPLPRGDDVGCNADVGDVYMTLYATRYGQMLSLAEATEDAGESINNRFPGSRRYTGSVATPQVDARIGAQTHVAYLTGPADGDRYSHARLAKVGEWIFKQRLTVRQDQIADAEARVSGPRWVEVLEAATKR